MIDPEVRKYFAKCMKIKGNFIARKGKSIFGWSDICLPYSPYLFLRAYLNDHKGKSDQS